MAAEQSLDIGTVAIIRRLEGRDRLASSDDGEALATVFYGVEKVGEAPRRLCGCDLRHLDQIIRLTKSTAAVGTLAGVPAAGNVVGDTRMLERPANMG